MDQGRSVAFIFTKNIWSENNKKVSFYYKNKICGDCIMSTKKSQLIVEKSVNFLVLIVLFYK